VAYRYRPNRQFRRRGPAEEDEEHRVQSTLLEYGHKAYTTSTSSAAENKPSEKVRATCSLCIDSR